MTQEYLPTTLDELSEHLAHLTPNSLILGGGTDLIIKMREHHLRPDVLLGLCDLPELTQVEITPDSAYFGAMVTMTQAQHATQDHLDLRAIAHAAGDVGSPQIRNKGTLGGNVANGSPAGDLPPVFWLLEAEVEILGTQNKRRTVPIREFITGVSQTVLQPQEVVIGLRIDRTKLRGYRTAFCKLGHRSKVTISRIGLCMALRQDENQVVQEARVVAGAIQTTPLILTQAEQLLVGQVPSLDLAEPIGKTFEGNTRRVYKAAAAKGVAHDLLKFFVSQ